MLIVIGDLILCSYSVCREFYMLNKRGMSKNVIFLSGKQYMVANVKFSWKCCLSFRHVLKNATPTNSTGTILSGLGLHLYPLSTAGQNGLQQKMLESMLLWLCSHTVLLHLKISEERCVNIAWLEEQSTGNEKVARSCSGPTGPGLPLAFLPLSYFYIKFICRDHLSTELMLTLLHWKLIKHHIKELSFLH